jgi:hypothetical protein
VPASFALPENATPELAPEGWSPQYPDYLYLRLHERDRIQPDRHAARPSVGQDDHDGAVGLSLVIAILAVVRAINIL